MWYACKFSLESPSEENPVTSVTVADPPETVTVAAFVFIFVNSSSVISTAE